MNAGFVSPESDMRLLDFHEAPCHLGGMAVKTLKSPCIDICVLETPSGECKGCRRTGQEIASWRSYSDVERDAVLAQLPARKAAAERQRKMYNPQSPP